MRFDHALRRAVAAAVAIAVFALAPDRPACLHTQALARLAADLEHRIGYLKVDLHEPDPRAESMQAATLESRGWHHHNPGGPVALAAGTSVEVTGLFNYADRGLFLELARGEVGVFRSPVTERPRIRVRIVVDAPGSDPERQRAVAMALIAKVIEIAAAP